MLLPGLTLMVHLLRYPLFIDAIVDDDDRLPVVLTW